MKRLNNSIRYAYYGFLIDLAMWKIKNSTSNDKSCYWVKILCKYAAKTIEI